MRQLLLVFAAVVLAPVVAHGDALQTRADITLGLLTPIGAAGLELGQELHENLEISAGLGMGFSGPQAASMVRVQTSGSFKLQLGAGASYGHFEDDDGCWGHECGNWTNANADIAWANAELAVYNTSASGRTFRAFIGVSTPIKIRDFERDERSDTEFEGAKLPYAGISFGMTL